jgi:hypothetical protein
LQVLLEGLHLLRSTPREGEDEESHHNVFLSTVLAQGDGLQIVTIEIFQRKIWCHVANLGHSGRPAFWFFALRRCRGCARQSQRAGEQQGWPHIS